MAKEIDIKEGIYTKTDNKEKSQIKFRYKTDLTATEKVKFVNSVTDLIVSDNYNSILDMLFFKYAIIEIFTDIDLSEISKSEDVISVIEKLIEDTDIIEIVSENVKDGLIESLAEAVDKNIEYKTGVKKQSIDTYIIKILSAIENKINNIDIEELLNLSRNIGSISNNFTPEKIIDAYAKTNVFKRNDKRNDEKFG